MLFSGSEKNRKLVGGGALWLKNNFPKFFLKYSKFCVELEKKMFLSYDPLTASFRPKNVKFWQFFRIFTDFFRNTPSSRREKPLSPPNFFLDTNFHGEFEKNCFVIQPSNG